MSDSKFRVIETGDKEWPIELSNGEGFAIQMNIEDAAHVLYEMHKVYTRLRWPELHRLINDPSPWSTPSPTSESSTE